jgi:hypothetical protein
MRNVSVAPLVRQPVLSQHSCCSGGVHLASRCDLLTPQLSRWAWALDPPCRSRTEPAGRSLTPAPRSPWGPRKFLVEIRTMLRASPAGRSCPPDKVGVPPRTATPLNRVELANGTCNVAVDSTAASFPGPPKGHGRPAGVGGAGRGWSTR